MRLIGIREVCCGAAATPLEGPDRRLGLAWKKSLRIGASSFWCKNPSPKSGETPPLRRCFRRGEVSSPPSGTDLPLSSAATPSDQAGFAAALGMARAVITQAQPANSMSMPTKRPMTQKADSGHSRQIIAPRTTEMTPLSRLHIQP